MDAGQLEARKTRARTWFETLRDDICAALEAVEDALAPDQLEPFRAAAEPGGPAARQHGATGQVVCQ